MIKTNIRLLLFVLLISAGISLRPAHAAQNSTKLERPLLNGREVIQLVNQVRASNGLPPYNTSGALMAAAETQSQYQASIGSTSHTGAGGSSVTSRAIAAGYGGGAAVSVVENVYSGMNAGAQQAVSWWQNDGTHLATLLSTNHQDAGAGMASADGVVYITLVVGAVTGAAGSAETQTAWMGGAATEGATNQEPQPGGQASGGFLLATPGKDGSVIHVVEAGQTLWTIAAMYKIGLADLLRINGLNDSATITPGQKIIIQPAGSLPTATFSLLNSEGTPVEAQDNLTETPKPTRTPRPTQAALAQSTAALNGTPDPEKDGQNAQTIAKVGQNTSSRFLGLDPLLLLIGVLVFGGFGLLITGSLLKRGE